MRPNLLVLLVLLGSLAGCVRAPATRRPVGIAAIAVHRDDRNLAPQLWYPAKIGSATRAYRARPIFVGVRVGRDAAYRASAEPRLPLIVLSHGNWGTSYSQGWLATQLVDAGYLVLSLQHPGTSAASRTTSGRIRLWERAADVTAALDAVLANPVWGTRIDRDRIGFVGHSFGAWTGLALAGGIYHVEREAAACASMADPDVYCAAMTNPDVAAVPLDGDGRSWRDERIRAFALLAGGPFAGFEPASLAAISTPVWIASAGADEVLDPNANTHALARDLPHARETIYPVGHFAFIPECNWLGRRIQKMLCRDRGETGRGALHREVAAQVIDLFDRHLVAAEPAR